MSTNKSLFKQMPMLSPLAINIMSFLQANSWLVRHADIVRILKQPDNSVRYQCRDLAKMGLIELEGRKYKITDKGEEILDQVFGSEIMAIQKGIFN